MITLNASQNIVIATILLDKKNLVYSYLLQIYYYYYIVYYNNYKNITYIK